MIEISHLTKRYGANVAVDDLNLTIDKGEIVGFLGPNGAGKSTTMNMITGYLSVSEGSIKVDGFDVLEHPYEVKKRIGYLPEQPPLYPDMTAAEYLSFVYDLKKVQKEKAKHLAECMALVKITDVANRRIKNLSKGYRQRVGLAQALLGNPEVLILDEPTVGLDPSQIMEIRDIIRNLGKNHTVILSSHIMQEISAVCERVLIINHGKLVVDSSIEDLNKGANDGVLSLKVKGTAESIKQALGSMEGVKDVKTAPAEAGCSSVRLTAEQDVREAVFYACAAADLPILEMKEGGRNLEQIFLDVIAKEETAEEEEA